MTGSPASIFSFTSQSESESSNSLQNSIVYPPTPPLEATDYHCPDNVAAPRPIPTKPMLYHELATPPFTPDDGIDERSKPSQDALNFLVMLFPRDWSTALPFAKSVSISAPNIGAAFDGVVLEYPGTPRTFYVDGKSAASVSLRERYEITIHFFSYSDTTPLQSVVALLDLADEKFHCSALVISLERSSPSLGDLLHSLMYVGGTVVTRPPFRVNSAYVLIGVDI